MKRIYLLNFVFTLDIFRASKLKYCDIMAFPNSRILVMINFLPNYMLLVFDDAFKRRVKNEFCLLSVCYNRNLNELTLLLFLENGLAYLYWSGIFMLSGIYRRNSEWIRIFFQHIIRCQFASCGINWYRRVIGRVDLKKLRKNHLLIRFLFYLKVAWLHSF